jgi:hypothetical protein
MMAAASRKARQPAASVRGEAKREPPEPMGPSTPRPRQPNRLLLAVAVTLFGLWLILLLLLVLSLR